MKSAHQLIIARPQPLTYDKRAGRYREDLKKRNWRADVRVLFSKPMSLLDVCFLGLIGDHVIVELHIAYDVIELLSDKLMICVHCRDHRYGFSQNAAKFTRVVRPEGVHSRCF